MEARQTLRGSDVSKGLLVAIAASLAIGLAVAGSIVAKDFTSSSAGAGTTVHAAPGTVLRQDNPPQAAQQGGPSSDLTRALPVESSAPAAAGQDRCERINHGNVC
jgi:hypothetical protein